MEILKRRNKNPSPIIIIMGFSFAILLSCYQVRPSIDVETVRKDLVSNGKDLIPEKFILKIRKTLFNVFYVDDFCLVHVPYKSYEGESFMKSSVVAIYIFKNSRWEYRTIIPYYYDFSQIQEGENYFLSSNEFCEPNGMCNSYFEISYFQNNDLIALKNYSGFDKFNYYDRLLSLDKEEEVKAAVGDTITSTVNIGKFDLNNKLKSFRLENEYSILLEVKDSLVTKTNKVVKKIEFEATSSK